MQVSFIPSQFQTEPSIELRESYQEELNALPVSSSQQANDIEELNFGVLVAYMLLVIG